MAAGVTVAVAGAKGFAALSCQGVYCVPSGAIRIRSRSFWSKPVAADGAAFPVQGGSFQTSVTLNGAIAPTVTVVSMFPRAAALPSR